MSGALVILPLLPGCSILVPNTECVSETRGAPCRTMYRSTAVSGSVLTADGSIGVFALASVGLRGKGSLQLTFFRLDDSRDPLTVDGVRLLTSRSMTTRREVKFDATGMSPPVTGEFGYSPYFPSIPIQVEFSSDARSWSREIDLRPSYAPNYIQGIGIEPKAPRTIEEFKARPPLPPSDKPVFTATERP